MRSWEITLAAQRLVSRPFLLESSCPMTESRGGANCEVTSTSGNAKETAHDRLAGCAHAPDACCLHGEAQ